MTSVSGCNVKSVPGPSLDREPQIPRSIGELEQVISAMSEALDDLYKKLDPVLLITPVEPNQVDPKPSTPKAPLSCTLDMFTFRLTELHDSVRSITDRVEL